MDVFFDTRKTNKTIEVISYFAFFFLNSGVYLFVNIPIILLTSNLVVLVLLTFNYDATIKKRLLSTVLIYLILMGVEMVVVLITGYFNFPIFTKNNYSSIYGLIICRVLTYVVVLVLNNFKNIKRGESVPTMNWLSIVLIPSASLYLVLLLFQARGLAVESVIAGVVLLLFVNFSVFYLYDVIIIALSERMEKRLAMEQNQYYEKQFELIQSSVQTTNMIRHDIKNHVLSLQALAEENKVEDLITYLDSIQRNVGLHHSFASSGNIIIDSILNFKFEEAQQQNVKTKLDLAIPEKLEISAFDMTVILGNLLDNAIRAAKTVRDNGFINVRIHYDKGRLLVAIDNSFSEKVIRENGRFLSTKQNRNNHGKGLANVETVLEKYHGNMNLEYEKNIFHATLLLYVD